MKLGSAITRAGTAWRANGIAGLRNAWWSYRHRAREDRDYRRWIETREAVENDENRLKDELARLRDRQLISVLLPVYNVDERWLRRCIESVTSQIYSNWELCIADDASPAPHVRRVLDEYAAEDSRIRVTYRTENGHISAASNSALEMASGEFVVLLDHDDELSRDALLRVAMELESFPETAMIYSDEDLIDESGRRFAPKFKPDFSLDLFYSLNLVTHLSAFRTELVREVGGFRLGFEGSQDYDLSLRVVEKIDQRQIRHIPHVLYHWRVIRGSVAFSMDEKPYAHERARQALREHFERTGVDAEVFESFHNLHRVSYRPAVKVAVSIIVVGSSGENRTGVERNVDVIETGSVSTEVLHDAVATTNTDVLIFLDPRLRFADDSYVNELARFAIQPNIGAVSGRIVCSNGFVDEAGLILSDDLTPSPAHRGYPAEAPGNMFRNRQTGNYAAISIGCFAIRRELFDQMGGFDSKFRSGDVAAIDLCLRLVAENKRVVIVPSVELTRSAATVLKSYDPADLTEFRERWSGTYAQTDPFCNTNLKRDGSFEIDV